MSEHEKPLSSPPPPSHKAARRQAARRLRVAQILFLAAFAMFAALAVYANLYPYFAWDVAVTKEIQTVNFPGMLAFMQLVSIPGNSFIPHLLTAATILAFLRFKRRTEAAGLLLSAGGGALFNAGLKLLINRPRPTANLVTVSQTLGTHSFPSGHVTFYTCYFGFLFFVAYALTPHATMRRRALTALLALPVLLIGFSRIYLGAHWASDTLGAYLFGGLWLAVSLEVYRHWKARSSLHPKEKLPVHS